MCPLNEGKNGKNIIEGIDNGDGIVNDKVTRFNTCKEPIMG